MRFKNDSQTSRTRALLPPLVMPCPMDRPRSLRPLPLSCMMPKPAGWGQMVQHSSRHPTRFPSVGRAGSLHHTSIPPLSVRQRWSQDKSPGSIGSRRIWHAVLLCLLLDGKPYASAFARAMTLSRIAARCSSEGIQFSEKVSRTSKPTEDISEAICFCASGAQP